MWGLSTFDQLYCRILFKDSVVVTSADGIAQIAVTPTNTRLRKHTSHDHKDTKKPTLWAFSYAG